MHTLDHLSHPRLGRLSSGHAPFTAHAAGMTLTALLHGLVWPFIRLGLLVCLGILAGAFLEALDWTRRLAVIARPLARRGRLSDTSAASFTVAFVSGVSANTMLAEAYDQGRLSRRELILANLFNGLPRFFLHLPTVFFMTLPLIGAAAGLYVGLTFAAALFQTLAVVLAGRLFLKKDSEYSSEKTRPRQPFSWKDAWHKSVQRFKRRIGRVALFMTPAYVAFFFLGRSGIFDRLQEQLASRAWFFSWLDPRAAGIVILHTTAEFSAGLAAAGALLDSGGLGARQVVLALLVGNILSTPIRALRHQLPYYLGIFPAGLATELIAASQLLRILAVVLTAAVYFFVTS